MSRALRENEIVGSHVVLTHVDHKIAVIGQSPLLIAYWKKFVDALNESKKIVLFGYKGTDKHLNEILQKYENKTFRVIEWESEGSFEDRKAFWGETLSSEEVDLLQMKNILEFTDWDDLPPVPIPF